jgi:hypothetical protein
LINDELLGQILLEVFFDHLCPDSKAAWPVLQQVTQAYPTQLQLIVHIFPLPYHRNAFFAAQSGLVIQSSLGDSAWWKWLDAVFQYQDNFGTPTTNNITGADVYDEFSKLAVPLGISEADFMNGESTKKFFVLNFFQGVQYGNQFDWNTRVAWKFATTRGVYGTPVFFVNGVQFPADSTWTLQQWQGFINSLLTPSL